MPSRADAIRTIFERHGDEAVYVASTGFIASAVYELQPQKRNVFYMQGSMGLAPAIGLGIALNTSRPVVVLSGDAALLMHLGITHTLRDCAAQNLHVYVLDNGCHESVGGQPAAPLEDSYPGVREIIRISRDGKAPRVGVTPERNRDDVAAAIAAPFRSSPDGRRA